MHILRHFMHDLDNIVDDRWSEFIGSPSFLSY